MTYKWYLLSKGKLWEQPDPGDHFRVIPAESEECWFDIKDAGSGELQTFLGPLDLHPLQMNRCLDSVSDPGVISFSNSLLMEYPSAINRESAGIAYITIILHDTVLVTVRHGEMPALDDLIKSLTAETSSLVHHLPQIIYMILDQFSDLNVEAQVAIRDQMLILSNTLARNHGGVSSSDLSHLRVQLENLISLVENQLYCISGLNACDNKALQDPHRNAYIQDLQSEMEIAQRGVYRLETRLRDLYSDWQSAGNELVEKRLRLLTIISAITLPLGLVAGLLGMNVGGLPGTAAHYGFIIVVVLMVLMVALEYWYFKRKGWFD